MCYFSLFGDRNSRRVTLQGQAYRKENEGGGGDEEEYPDSDCCCCCAGCCSEPVAAKPLVFCEIELPEGYLDAIKSQSKGVYASRLPLVPIYITVDGFVEGMVSYTVHYFPFGTVGMRYVAQDGYNVEKPLTGR